jgi:hypothetical protein
VSALPDAQRDPEDWADDGRTDRTPFDRRAAFFLIAALLCLVLTPVAESEYAWVCIGLGVIYVLLAVASYLDARTRARTE